MPSMLMEPVISSASRSIATVKLLLPAPVRPQIPIFSPGLIVQLTSLSAGVSPGRYRSITSFHSRRPAAGQPDGGRPRLASLSVRVSSASSRENSHTRSMLTLCVSTCVTDWTIHERPHESCEQN